MATKRDAEGNAATNGDATRGFIREAGNQMSFTTGEGTGHGFSFPKTGIYIVDGNLKVRSGIGASGGHNYFSAQMSKDKGATWNTVGITTAWQPSAHVDNFGNVNF